MICGLCGEKGWILMRKQRKKVYFFPFFPVFCPFCEGNIIFTSFFTIFLNFTKKLAFFINIDYNISGKTWGFYRKKRVIKKCVFYPLFALFFVFFHEKYVVLNFWYVGFVGNSLAFYRFFRISLFSICSWGGKNGYFLGYKNSFFCKNICGVSGGACCQARWKQLPCRFSTVLGKTPLL